MSEHINNREHRKQVIRDMIWSLHEGKTVEDVKEAFSREFGNVAASEITEVEQELISEGLPVSEVQRLCDVHSAVFRGSIEEIHRPEDPAEQPGHPVWVLHQENELIDSWISEKIRPHLDTLTDAASRQAVLDGIRHLRGLDRHYARKENLFFPYMEKNGITAPPQVMWGVDDEIRAQRKEIENLLAASEEPVPGLEKKLDELITKVTEMAFKEEHIMVPMLTEVLNPEDWGQIAAQSGELGYLIDVPEWRPAGTAPESAQPEQPVSGDTVTLPSGAMSVAELTAMLNTLPMDITFVGADDKVRFFSETSDRVFARTRAIVGRDVANCHPPASVHVVEKVVEDLRSGRKDHEDFWIRMGERLILIRYYAVRDEKGTYLGVVETTQDIAPLQDIQGEKRLMSD